MDKNDIEDHKKAAKTLNWDQLAENIMDLEIEKDELFEFLSDSEISDYNMLIDIYEDYKLEIIANTAIYVPYEYY